MAGEERCVTCGDVALAACVLGLSGDGRARVQTGEGEIEINVELVDVEVGDRVLVHAGVAIAVAP